MEIAAASARAAHKPGRPHGDRCSVGPRCPQARAAAWRSLQRRPALRTRPGAMNVAQGRLSLAYCHIHTVVAESWVIPAAAGATGAPRVPKRSAVVGAL